MFQLSDDELANLKSQIVTSSWGDPRRAKPYAFTEQGVAMLSGILRRNRAVQVNIEIMRAFVRLRQLLLAWHTELAGKLLEMEKVQKDERMNHPAASGGKLTPRGIKNGTGTAIGKTCGYD